MKTDPFACSDRIARLRDMFAGHVGGPVSMNDQAVEWLWRELCAAFADARAAENEISRLKWNRIGTPDPDRVAAAMAADGSNVVALVIPRPFDDGGRAA